MDSSCIVLYKMLQRKIHIHIPLVNEITDKSVNALGG